ncbi:hypothetical protein M885DRAFT_305859 [Pelagophyceae sp. CCMP2097]|nr:hypothetical protein M885DRAFT_305859 [Pelagophyceae sp. CCMP2097]
MADAATAARLVEATKKTHLAYAAARTTHRGDAHEPAAEARAARPGLARRLRLSPAAAVGVVARAKSPAEAARLARCVLYRVLSPLSGDAGARTADVLRAAEADGGARRVLARCYARRSDVAAFFAEAWPLKVVRAALLATRRGPCGAGTSADVWRAKVAAALVARLAGDALATCPVGVSVVSRNVVALGEDLLLPALRRALRLVKAADERRPAAAADEFGADFASSDEDDDGATDDVIRCAWSRALRAALPRRERGGGRTDVGRAVDVLCGEVAALAERLRRLPQALDGALEGTHGLSAAALVDRVDLLRPAAPALCCCAVLTEHESQLLAHALDADGPQRLDSAADDAAEEPRSLAGSPTAPSAGSPTARDRDEFVAFFFDASAAAGLNAAGPATAYDVCRAWRGARAARSLVRRYAARVERQSPGRHGAAHKARSYLAPTRSSAAPAVKHESPKSETDRFFSESLREAGGPGADDVRCGVDFCDALPGDGRNASVESHAQAAAAAFPLRRRSGATSPRASPTAANTPSSRASPSTRASPAWRRPPFDTKMDRPADAAGAARAARGAVRSSAQPQRGGQERRAADEAPFYAAVDDAYSAVDGASFESPPSARGSSGAARGDGAPPPPREPDASPGGAGPPHSPESDGSDSVSDIEELRVAPPPRPQRSSRPPPPRGARTPSTGDVASSMARMSAWLAPASPDADEPRSPDADGPARSDASFDATHVSAPARGADNGSCGGSEASSAASSEVSASSPEALYGAAALPPSRGGSNAAALLGGLRRAPPPLRSPRAVLDDASRSDDASQWALKWAPSPEAQAGHRVAEMREDTKEEAPTEDGGAARQYVDLDVTDEPPADRRPNRGAAPALQLLAAPGVLVRKHCRHARPHAAHVTVDASGSHLQWTTRRRRSLAASPLAAGLAFAEVIAVRTGLAHSDVLARHGRADHDALYVSVVTRFRTLDLECATPQLRDAVAAAVRHICDVSKRALADDACELRPAAAAARTTLRPAS